MCYFHDVLLLKKKENQITACFATKQQKFELSLGLEFCNISQNEFLTRFTFLFQEGR